MAGPPPDGHDATMEHEERSRAQAAELEAHGRVAEAREAYLKASAYYSIAKFPVIDHPAKQAAYRKCIDTYLKAAKYFDPPMEVVRIPFEGKQIIGYFWLPPGGAKPGSAGSGRDRGEGSAGRSASRKPHIPSASEAGAQNPLDI